MLIQFCDGKHFPLEEFLNAFQEPRNAEEHQGHGEQADQGQRHILRDHYKEQGDDRGGIARTVQNHLIENGAKGRRTLIHTHGEVVRRMAFEKAHALRKDMGEHFLLRAGNHVVGNAR